MNHQTFQGLNVPNELSNNHSKLNSEQFQRTPLQQRFFKYSNQTDLNKGNFAEGKFSLLKNPKKNVTSGKMINQLKSKETIDDSDDENDYNKEKCCSEEKCFHMYSPKKKIKFNSEEEYNMNLEEIDNYYKIKEMPIDYSIKDFTYITQNDKETVRNFNDWMANDALYFDSDIYNDF